MASTFKIVISATDKATATVRKVKDSIAQFTRPVTQVQASVKALGKELGVEKMAKGIKGMANRARELSSRVGGVVTSMAALTGIGTIAGVAALARGWGMLGLEVTRTAGLLDIATNKFQALTGATEAFGLERSAMVDGLKAIGDTMENAVFGRDQNALVMMNRLGISLHRTKNGSVDAAQGLYDVADAIYKIKNVQAQGVVARTFGVEGLLPFLQLGRKGMQQYEEQAKRSGAILSGPALASAQKLARGLIFLKMSATGAGNSIMESLTPSLLPVIAGITGWVTANRALIAVGVKDFVTGLVVPVVTVAKWLGTVIEKTIGWKAAGMALAIMLSANLIPLAWGLVAPLARVAWWFGILAIRAVPVLISGIGALSGVLAGVLAPAFTALGAAIETTPVGWIITALAAIGFAGYELWKHWREITAGLSKLWQAIPFMFVSGYHKIQPVIRALASIPFFGDSFRIADNAVGNFEGRLRSGGTDPKRAAAAMAFYQSKGWSKEQAAGLVGNLAWESGLDPRARGDDGSATGIAQWHKDRAAAFRQWSGGRDLAGASLQDQLEFSNFELTQGNERGAGAALRRQRTVAGSVAAAMYGYERPANGSSESGRLGLAQQFYGAGGTGGAGAGGMSHEPHVTITVKGLPKDAKVTAESTGKKKPDVRVDYSMPDLAAM